MIVEIDWTSSSHQVENVEGTSNITKEKQAQSIPHILDKKARFKKNTRKQRVATRQTISDTHVTSFVPLNVVLNCSGIGNSACKQKKINAIARIIFLLQSR